MRSKEVEEAIKRIKKYQRNVITELTLVNSIDTLLSYIEQLEKQIPTTDNCVPVEWQMSLYVDKRDAVMKDKIRDKIKELEEEKEKYVGYKGLEFSRIGVINSQIKVLEEIKGE